MERKVLDDKVEHVIRILDAGDGYFPDLLNEGGEDDGMDVGPELRLEGQGAVGVEEVVHEPFVLAVEELAATVCELIEAPRALRGEDVTGLEESLTAPDCQLQRASRYQKRTLRTYSLSLPNQALSS